MNDSHQTEQSPRKLALLAAALLLLATSAWAQPLAGLPVQGNIAIPDKPHYFGSHQGLAGVFGLLGGLAASPAVEDSRDKIKHYMEKQGIDIRQIVLAAYRRSAEAVPELSLPKDGAPHTVKLEILSYGVSARRPFADEYKPWLRLRLDILDKSNRSEFDEDSFINNLTDGTPTHALDKFFADPDVLRAALARAAQLATAELVKSLADRYERKR